MTIAEQELNQVPEVDIFTKTMDAIMAAKGPDKRTNIEAALRAFEAEIRRSKAKGGRSRVDQISRINEMTNILDVRKAIKVANAKKSKAKDNPESLARYEAEIEAAQKKLNELLAQAGNDPLKLKELGENPARITQQYVISKEDVLNDRLGSFNIKKADKKKLMTVQSIEPNDFFDDLNELGDEVKMIFFQRRDKGDQRVQNVIRMANLFDYLSKNPDALKQQADDQQ